MDSRAFGLGIEDPAGPSRRCLEGRQAREDRSRCTRPRSEGQSPRPWTVVRIAYPAPWQTCTAFPCQRNASNPVDVTEEVSETPERLRIPRFLPSSVASAELSWGLTPPSTSRRSAPQRMRGGPSGGPLPSNQWRPSRRIGVLYLGPQRRGHGMQGRLVLIPHGQPGGFR
jgi:hypothetical protein